MEEIDYDESQMLELKASALYLERQANAFVEFIEKL